MTNGNGKTKKNKVRSNVFTDTVGITAREGIHAQATVILTEHVGRVQTINGPKDMQMFHLQVSQFNDAGDRETAEIHQQFTRSFHPQSALTSFLKGFGIDAQRGMTLDFDDLVGKKVDIIVTHRVDINGVKHANIKAIPPKHAGGSQ